MKEKHGSLSITSENIFPVIKKWLYSDHDIFLRELVSNACDAITKLKKLDAMGEFSIPAGYKPEVHIIFDSEKKTLTISDNGIGMTEDEVEKYINQIAFSGATDFLTKFKDKGDQDQIIGHFGLGFYSAFMVADLVTIDSLSYQDGAKAVHWECDGGTDFSMKDGERDHFGTTITLHLNEDCLEFCNEYRVRELINKYCSFMPTPIYLEKANAETEYEEINPDDKRDDDTVIETVHHDAKTHEKKNDDGSTEVVEDEPAKDMLKIVKRPVALNDTNPLWMKTPSECTDEEYKTFYRKVFNDYKEPLCWIHLNMDYPFNLKGILYFPKINSEYDSIEGTIKLYNNQVFVADNIKEVIPEFLMLLKGVIDCPDLPLNVSRSALQNDGFVKKISDYITKKVADKLSGLCKTDRESYEKYWDDISPFIKYGCLKDDKFCDKMNDYILFKDIYDKYTTLPDLLKKEEKPEDTTEEKKDENTASDSEQNAAPEEEKDTRKSIYYVTDLLQQSQYIQLFKEQKQNAVILDKVIDTSFISQLEQRNPDYKFLRIDADLTDSLVENDGADLKSDTDTLSEIFKKAIANDKLTINVMKIKNKDTAAILNVSEEMRRMQDMMKMYSMNGSGMDASMFAAPETLVLNDDHELVRYIIDHKDSDFALDFAKQIYDMAKLANAPLDANQMTEFLKRSNKIMLALANK